jgi:type I restriction-modification system DNA methylase subunit
LEIQLLSERDLVAQKILPRFKEASRILDISDVLDFHIDSRVDGGIADLFAEKGGRRLFVLEAKFKKKEGRLERDIEPRDPQVIEQAARYALHGGFPFFVTCNDKRIILFKHMTDRPPLQSEVVSFDYATEGNWAERILSIILNPNRVVLKALDDSLVDTLKEAFNDLLPEFLTALKDRLDEKQYRKLYVEWLQNQGIQLNDETNRLMAEQSCYLQLNKLLFYQVIKTIYPDRLDTLQIREHEDVDEALDRFYKQARKIDYAPVYEPDVLSQVPLTRRGQERFRTLIDTLNEFNFAGMQSDFLGQVYEKLIPPKERKRLGQFYTPLSIVELIIALTLKDKDATILDPSCGSGTFLIKAYDKLRDLKDIPRENHEGLAEEYHKELLSQIFGVDINQFPAHLSVINLSIQNPKSRVDHVNVAVKDFFDIKAGQSTLSGFESVTAEGKGSVIDLPTAFDVVVANPPYIRQQFLGEKEKRKIGQLIGKEFGSKLSVGSSEKRRGEVIVLDKQSDIYLYFFVHSLELLKNNGFLGFITSNKWLEVEYGVPFQELLLKHTRILCIIEFDRAIFPDADVNTAVTILEKENDKRKRNENTVKFVRVKQKLDFQTLVNLVNETVDSIEDDQIRINVVPQGELELGKWNVYLRAPAFYSKITRNSKVTKLNNVAKVFRGAVTGYNDFFIVNKQAAKDWGIEKNYLKPVMTSPKKIRGLIVRKEGLDEFLLLCHEDKADLKGKNVLRYIEHGEKIKVKIEKAARPIEVTLPNVPTIRVRNLWYNLPEFDVPPIIFQELYDKRTRALWNEAAAHARAPLSYCIPKDGVDARVLISFLNSSLAQILFELYGRSYGGGVLDIKVYELKLLPVINPSNLSLDQKEELWKSFVKLDKAILERIELETKIETIESKSNTNEGLFEKQIARDMEDASKVEKEAQRNLDSLIYELLGLNNKERKQVEDALAELQEIRKLRRQV